MVLTFLIPLFTGLVTGYIFKKSTDEIGYLAGGIAIFSFVISLILAPWEVQLLLLVFVLVITQRLLQQNEYKMKLQDDSTDIPIKESEVKSKGTIHKYRGANYPVKNYDFISEQRETGT
jgi:hypothetical protein